MFRAFVASATIVERGVNFGLGAVFQDFGMLDPIVRTGVNLGVESCGWLCCLWL